MPKTMALMSMRNVLRSRRRPLRYDSPSFTDASPALVPPPAGGWGAMRRRATKAAP